MSVLEHKELARRWEALIKERAESGMPLKNGVMSMGSMNPDLTTGQGHSVQSGMPFVELPAVCQEQRTDRVVAFIRWGNVSIEITEDTTADFIAEEKFLKFSLDIRQ